MKWLLKLLKLLWAPKPPQPLPADIYQWEAMRKDLLAAGFNQMSPEQRHEYLTSKQVSPQAWVATLARIRDLTARGRILSRFVSVYGLPSRLSADDTFALHLAVDYARGLRVLAAAEAATFAAGRPGQWHTYLAMADGDEQRAQSLADDAVTKEAFRVTRP